MPRGGLREGAGRKKKGIRRIVSVNMPKEFWDYADEFETFSAAIDHLFWISKRNDEAYNGKLELQQQLIELRNWIQQRDKEDVELNHSLDKIVVGMMNLHRENLKLIHILSENGIEAPEISYGK